MFNSLFKNGHVLKVFLACLIGIYAFTFYASHNLIYLIEMGKSKTFILMLYQCLGALGYGLSLVVIGKFFENKEFIIKTLLFSMLLFYFRKTMLATPMMIVMSGFVFCLFIWFEYRKLILFIIILTILNVVQSISQYVHLNQKSKYLYSVLYKEDKDIVDTVFKRVNNVYYIQPDGYANIATLKRSPYLIDNIKFSGFLKEKGFISYKDVTSNYSHTLASNVSSFNLKHHYNKISYNDTETLGARHVIAGDNQVLKVFKNNGYQTYMFSQIVDYLTGGECYYSKCSKIDRIDSMVDQIGVFLKNKKTRASKHFVFIEYSYPSHISTYPETSVGEKGERDNYVENIAKSNALMEGLINNIVKYDPSSLIIIASDHGGYVGYNNSSEPGKKVLSHEDSSKLNIETVFSVILSIKWPDLDGFPRNQQLNQSSLVNMFRYILAYMSGTTKSLMRLSTNESYIGSTSFKKNRVLAHSL